jgi:hypothetical protein
MAKESLKIGETWKLPLTRLQIEELDKMVDYYTKLYRKEKPKVETKAWYMHFK